MCVNWLKRKEKKFFRRIFSLSIGELFFLPKEIFFFLVFHIHNLNVKIILNCNQNILYIREC